MKKLLITLLVLTPSIWAKGGVDIAVLIKDSFSKTATVTKKQFRLSSKAQHLLQKEAKAKMDSNVVRLYTIKDKGALHGYAVLLIKKVRTKSAAILYMIDTQQRIKNIEIVAFNEPPEYKPNESWQESFKGKRSTDNLFTGKGIPIISGATLSARAISDAARLALAIVEHSVH